MRKLFSNSIFWRNALRLAIPIAFQNLLMSSFAMVDTLMIGQLGDVALAGVGMAGQWNWLMQMLLFGTSSGAAVFISQYWGIRDKRGIHKAYSAELIISLVVSLPFMLAAIFAPEAIIGFFSTDPATIAAGSDYLRLAAFSYMGIAFNISGCTLLRSTEEVKLPMYASMLAVAVNAGLNAVLIFGLLGFEPMGVRGAALATAISSWISPLLLYAVSYAKRNMLCVPIKEIFSFDGEFVLRFVKKALPVVINESLWGLGTVIFQRIYGMMGTEYYAAITIFKSMENIAFVFYVGFCNACTVTVGKSIGAGDYKSAKEDGMRYSVLLPIVAFIVGMCVIALRGTIVSWFDVNAAVAQNAMHIMLIYGLEIPFRILPYITIVGIFRAGGDTRTAMLIDLGTLWLISLPVTYICANFTQLPFALIYLIMLIAEDVPKFCLCLWRIRSGKWIKPVI